MKSPQGDAKGGVCADLTVLAHHISHMGEQGGELHFKYEDGLAL